MVKEDLLVIKCNGCSRELKCVGEGELSIETINISCSHCNERSTYTKPKSKAKTVRVPIAGQLELIVEEEKPKRKSKDED